MNLDGHPDINRKVAHKISAHASLSVRDSIRFVTRYLESAQSKNFLYLLCPFSASLLSYLLI